MAGMNQTSHTAAGRLTVPLLAEGDAATQAACRILRPYTSQGQPVWSCSKHVCLSQAGSHAWPLCRGSQHAPAVPASIAWLQASPPYS